MPFGGSDYATSAGARIVKIAPFSKCRVFVFCVSVPRESFQEAGYGKDVLFRGTNCTQCGFSLYNLFFPPHMAFCIPLELFNNYAGIFMIYNINSRSRAVNSQLGLLGCEYARKMLKKKKSLEQIHMGNFSHLFLGIVSSC